MDREALQGFKELNVTEQLTLSLSQVFTWIRDRSDVFVDVLNSLLHQNWLYNMG